jgi:hypothetical protein
VNVFFPSALLLFPFSFYLSKEEIEHGALSTQDSPHSPFGSSGIHSGRIASRDCDYWNLGCFALAGGAGGA